MRKESNWNKTRKIISIYRDALNTEDDMRIKKIFDFFLDKDIRNKPATDQELDDFLKKIS